MVSTAKFERRAGVKSQGHSYIGDTQAGAVSGPFPEGTPSEDLDWPHALDPTPDDPTDGDLPPHNPDSIKRRQPTDCPWNDPKPWHTDPDMQRHFEDESGCDVDDDIYDSAGLLQLFLSSRLIRLLGLVRMPRAANRASAFISVL
ncbi:MAG: hypothetical protein Kow0022_12920 [Phycisphaerales bacterium]